MYFTKKGNKGFFLKRSHDLTFFSGGLQHNKYFDAFPGLKTVILSELYFYDNI